MPAADDKLSCDAAMRVARSCLMSDTAGKLHRPDADSAVMTKGAVGLAGGSGGVSCTLHGFSASWLGWLPALWSRCRLCGAGLANVKGG